MKKIMVSNDRVLPGSKRKICYFLRLKTQTPNKFIYLPKADLLAQTTATTLCNPQTTIKGILTI